MKSQHKKPLHIYFALFTGLTLAMGSCKKFVEIPPPVNQLTAATVFSSDATASAAIAGIYSRLSQSGFIQAITPYAAMYADETVNYEPGNQGEFALSQLTRISSPALNTNFWNLGYQYIYFANAAIGELNTGSGVSPALKANLTGEAKFIRAYLYLNLSSLFGDVPLITDTRYQSNATFPRSPKAQVMQFIIEDLKEAVELLGEQTGGEKVRANRYAAMALLARAYLYNGEWALAQQSANAVIESKKYTMLTDPSKVFLKNSSEAILQLYPTQTNQNTPDGLTFLPATAAEQPKYVITPALLSAFEPADLRKSAWIASRIFLGQSYAYPAKYRVINTSVLSEYLMVLRLAEQYLIRGEARIQLGDIENGIADLNVIRKRARPAPAPTLPNPVPDLSGSISKAEALLAMEKERQTELMCEMGHRWLDLQRTGRADKILKAVKPDTWTATAILWPIPEEQLRLNPFLEQNPGYNK
ncbi:RagB/SusD family nutrient uptake outer membrane protein [Pedobacter psychrodurus]|uniref:RagB/SusD family nutrient uptake outer membrane protein n=1 Tax=Pedobacter psychrodurus TaxID=2530456 RepID=A0A4R0Q617_9SPHI|nr:RagB/SusD family nutrient uptake outer membrane protein [Pedobacter psychrodurus]TCD28629.1 RagB/SusD family nutrient uptake outer membrane protein [Pedobacter psychrodurus]